MGVTRITITTAPLNGYRRKVLGRTGASTNALSGAAMTTETTLRSSMEASAGAET